MNENDHKSKNRLYKNYISTHFGNIHNEIKKDYRTFYRYYNRNYSRFIPNNTNINILEIGCGMGHFLYYLQKKGYQNYLGVDISEENINFCKTKKFHVAHIDIFDFLKSGVEPFDVIIMNDVIEHFNKAEILQLLDLIKNNLTDDGIVIIKAPNSSNPILSNSSRYYDFTHEISFTEESMFQILKVCGYKNVRIYPQNIYIFYSNPINYIAKIIAGVLNFVFRLTFILYGRKTTKIFTKDIIAVASK